MITMNEYNSELSLILNYLKSSNVKLERTGNINELYLEMYPDNELSIKTVGTDSWNRHDFNQVCHAILQGNPNPIVEHIEVEEVEEVEEIISNLDDTVITE